MSELEFIEFIKHANQSKIQGGVGIGDDAAVIFSDGVKEVVIATDMLLETKHFDLVVDAPELVGRKALAVNISDLAAMGATPCYAFVSLAFPKDFGMLRAKRIWRGLQNLADEYRIQIVGGDTNSWNSGLVINVSLVGTAPKGGCVLRSGAQAGDIIYVTGSLGGSLISGHHLSFIPKLKESHCLLKKVRPTAMIDISDGLVRDLNHICEASGVGANLISNKIPISDRVPSNLPDSLRLSAALHDGEDFELLFTVPATDAHFVSTFFSSCFAIGTVSKGGLVCLDGIPVEIRGYEHNF